MSTEIKPGRPPAGEEAPTMKTIHVRVDAETHAILKQLERRCIGPKRGRTSQVVRAAIHAAAARRR